MIIELECETCMAVTKVKIVSDDRAKADVETYGCYCAACGHFHSRFEYDIGENGEDSHRDVQ